MRGHILDILKYLMGLYTCTLVFLHAVAYPVDLAPVV
jgi:hypothetical protein